jgi:GNAT superfamily N-acetyltransferase
MDMSSKETFPPLDLQSFTIRAATERDCEAVMGLIHELAAFELEPDSVTNTADQLRMDGFGPNPLFECLVIEANAGIVGFALWYYRYSTWNGKRVYLEDLYIQPAYRNQNLGLKAFEAVVARAKDAGCSAVCWQVLDWNTKAQDFYKRIGAKERAGWMDMLIEIA